MNKKDARILALNQRKSENPETVSTIVLKDIKESKLLEGLKTVGIYYPLGKEINILGLMNDYKDISFYLPVTKENIFFVKYNLNDELLDGPFHTKEPVGEAICRDNIEAFLIPCVAISKNNQRIGYGKGYYDRYLEGYKGLKIGICYKNSSNLDIDCDAFDVKLDYKFIG